MSAQREGLLFIRDDEDPAEYRRLVEEAMARSDADLAAERSAWRWRNCRSVGVSVEIWPLDWSFGLEMDADVYGGCTVVSVGPLTLKLSYSIGGLSNPFRLAPELADAPAEACGDGAQPILPPGSEPSGPCETCGGRQTIRIVNDLYRPDRDEPCPTCVGWPVPGMPGLVMKSKVPR